MENTMIEIDQAASVLKLLGDKTRLTIVGLLKDGECCVCEFVEVLQMSQPSISQHLRKLRDSGLVKERKKGQWVFYSLNADHEAFIVIQSILTFIPEQKDKLYELEQKGLRICCD
ncbi:MULTISPECIES: helix-turn-helix transcriptional regulator [Bacillaceae]|uniref:ArsR/SmtB family transcription factor n=1 Tax=Bacillales TaxID=1385 RepID=UPI001883AF4C|nr:MULTISPECIES: metalloregulator ArsR/SmtB family transcription factor [Bacillaceae]MBF0707380.1 winged helix-turn-helix transcriptional regulator [Pseudalkalibacillus hwajinpoensis]MDO6654845.1 metalloregulator ArsR/SmtB family transcription factor [Anaerobacillus sp. 1_MG-2023]